MLGLSELVVSEKLAETNGVAGERLTTHTGCFFEMMDAHRRNVTGNTSADASFASIPPDGYGVTWALKPGDKLITATGRSVSVLRVTAVEQPRSGVLHHVEAEAG